MHASWTQKYRPRHLSEVAGNKDSILILREWFTSWSGSPPKKKGALLYGPAGTGKTVTAEAASRDLGFDLVEMNASDKRSTALVERVVGTAVEQGSLTADKRLILLDEVDGIDPSTDRGAVEAMASAIERTRWPVVLTANDPWDPRLSALRSVCLMIQFKRLGLRDSIPYLKRICLSENIEVEEKALRFIVERNEGDMRSILNDLETLSAGTRTLAYDDVTWLGHRDRKESIFEVLGSIFNAKTCMWAKKAAGLANVDQEMLFEWLYENAPTQIEDPRDRARALEALAKADLFMARIRRTQDWGLLSYAIDLMTAGVAMSREHAKTGWVKMRFPERLKLKAKARRQKALKIAIGRKIASKCHTSTNNAIKYYLPYVKQMLEEESETAEELVRWLDLDEEMTESLTLGVTKSKRP